MFIKVVDRLAKTWGLPFFSALVSVIRRFSVLTQSHVKRRHSPTRIPVSLISCMSVPIFFPKPDANWSSSVSVGRNSGSFCT